MYVLNTNSIQVQQSTHNPRFVICFIRDPLYSVFSLWTSAISPRASAQSTPVCRC